MHLRPSFPPCAAAAPHASFCCCRSSPRLSLQPATMGGGKLAACAPAEAVPLLPRAAACRRCCFMPCNGSPAGPSTLAGNAQKTAMARAKKQERDKKAAGERLVLRGVSGWC